MNECPKIKKGWWIFKWTETQHAWGKWSVIGHSRGGTPLHERTCACCGVTQTYVGTP